MKNIKQITFPNSAPMDRQEFYTVGLRGVDEIRPIKKAGEMAGITWFQIIKDGEVIAEIKESVCHVFGQDSPGFAKPFKD